MDGTSQKLYEHKYYYVSTIFQIYCSYVHLYYKRLKCIVVVVVVVVFVVIVVGVCVP